MVDNWCNPSRQIESAQMRVPSVLLSCQVEIPATGVWHLMSASGGVDHSPDPELNAMVAMADAYTQLVFL